MIEFALWIIVGLVVIGIFGNMGGGDNSEIKTTSSSFDSVPTYEDFKSVAWDGMDTSYEAYEGYLSRREEPIISWFEKKKKAIMKWENLRPINGSKNDPYYIYFYYIEGVVKYVGKGKTVLNPNINNEHKFITYHRAGNIYDHKHCKPYMDKISIKIIETFECEKKALVRESVLIAQYGLENLLNKKV